MPRDVFDPRFHPENLRWCLRIDPGWRLVEEAGATPRVQHRCAAGAGDDAGRPGQATVLEYVPLMTENGLLEVAYCEACRTAYWRVPAPGGPPFGPPGPPP